MRIKDQKAYTYQLIDQKFIIHEVKVQKLKKQKEEKSESILHFIFSFIDSHFTNKVFTKKERLYRLI